MSLSVRQNCLPLLRPGIGLRSLGLPPPHRLGRGLRLRSRVGTYRSPPLDLGSRDWSCPMSSILGSRALDLGPRWNSRSRSWSRSQSASLPFQLLGPPALSLLPPTVTGGLDGKLGVMESLVFGSCCFLELQIHPLRRSRQTVARDDNVDPDEGIVE